MKILHTSDWHLGRRLYGRKRYEEFAQFLEWLRGLLDSQRVDVLLIAGDVFDTRTPSNRAQALYYQFLCDVARSHCRHVVVIGGNHDSPSFLNAPQTLLSTINVHVVGSATEDPADEVIVLRSSEQKPLLIVCAVPYLRDKDIRSVVVGESQEDKNAKLLAGIKQHYQQVCEHAQQQQAELLQAGHPKIPLVAMGHLFTSGAKTMEGDGVRDLYVGSLAHISADLFPDCIDYLALGHLHVPQQVGGQAHLRYCGSPLPMGYGEATQTKQVIGVTFNAPDDAKPVIQSLAVPCFQKLVRITGSLAQIQAKIQTLKQADSQAWLEIEYTGTDMVRHLREHLHEAVDGSALEIRRIKNQRITQQVMRSLQGGETLDDLSVDEVFVRCLDNHQVPPDKRTALTAAYHEVIRSLQEEDLNAE